MGEALLSSEYYLDDSEGKPIKMTKLQSPGQNRTLMTLELPEEPINRPVTPNPKTKAKPKPYDETS